MSFNSGSEELVVAFNKLKIFEPYSNSVCFLSGRVFFAVFVLPEFKLFIGNLFFGVEVVEGEGSDGEECQQGQLCFSHDRNYNHLRVES